MRSLLSVLTALGVPRVSKTKELFQFNKNCCYDLFTYFFWSGNRGNAEGNTEADGCRWTDHLSCEKSFAGIDAISENLGLYFNWHILSAKS